MLGAITWRNTRIGAGSVVVRNVESDYGGGHPRAGDPPERVDQPLALALPDEASADPKPDGADRRTGEHHGQPAALPAGSGGRPSAAEVCRGEAQNLKDREILEFLGDASEPAEGT